MMRVDVRMRIAMAVAVLAMGAGSATAQLSLSTVVDLATKNDPRVKMAEADLAKAKAALSQARDAYVPTAIIQGGYGTSVGVPLSVPTVFSFQSQSLAFNFSQQDYVRAASVGVKSAELALQNARDQAAEDASTSYVSLDNAQARHAAMQQEYEAASRLATIVQDRLDAGEDTKVELLKARRTAKQIYLAQLKLEDDIAAQTDHLTRLLGIPGASFATVPGSIPAISMKDATPATQVMSPGVMSAFASAQSKQETAFGDLRYRFRPQVTFGINFSYIDTSHTNYLDYYPGFKDKSRDAASVGVQVTIPLFDKGHEAKAHEAVADAAHARADAENIRNQFLEGRFKLGRAATELEARSEVSELDFELAEEQLKTVQIQLSGPSGDPNATQLTPKDEQNARVQERQRYIDMLDAQIELRKAQLQLMRQNGTLDDWLKKAATTLSTP